MLHPRTHPASIARLVSFCERKHYAAQSVIIEPGASAERLYYIAEGTVTVSMRAAPGRELVLAHLGAGDFIGAHGLFLEQDSGNVRVQARSRCELAAISYRRLRQLVKHELAAEYADILFVFGVQMAARMRAASRKMCDLAFVDVNGRIISALHELSRGADAIVHERSSEVRITRQELGRIAGCSREMAGRVLKELQEQKKIAVKGRSIMVFNASGARSSGESSGPVFSLV